MFFVPENAPREDKAITDLINQGLDSERLFKAAWTLHQFKISQLQAQKGEASIQSGLFKGTILNPESFSSQFMPKYIGTYEREVQNHLATIETQFDGFLNIGCADGFYLACIARWLRIPCIGVDIDPRSDTAVSFVSQANGVSDLVSFNFSIDKAVQRLSGSILILIDVDGAESKVLSELLESLSKNHLVKHAHLILETDQKADGDKMNQSELIHDLCAQHWSIDSLLNQDPTQRFLPQLSQLSFLDQVALAAEGRMGGQSWIVAIKTYNLE